MGIGGSIFLIAVGAIIAFGVRQQSLGPLDLTVIGWILMLVGLFGLFLTLYFWNTRRRRVVMQQQTPVERHVVQQQPVNRRVVHQVPPGTRTYVDEQSYTPPPPEDPRV